MKIIYPHIIKNCIGETLIFKELVKDPAGDKLLVENFVQPGIGPAMHTHWLQDECLTVVKGRLGYQVAGEEKKYAAPGETVLFEKGTAHRFWNDGEDELHCSGYIQPAHSIVYFLTGIFNAQNKSGNAKPALFDTAYLLTRYSTEFDLAGIPSFVKKIIFPLVHRVGNFLGKYDHFKDAPHPVQQGH
jgi:quercetin dioxygenase-like cupin family protein